MTTELKQYRVNSLHPIIDGQSEDYAGLILSPCIINTSGKCMLPEE
jgi:hypothetical protein